MVAWQLEDGAHVFTIKVKKPGVKMDNMLKHTLI